MKKKNNLIIYAHPNKNGHCGKYLEEVEFYLKSQNLDYDIIDLYEESFNPVLGLNEFYINNKDLKMSDDVLDYQKKISEYYNIIFIYPNWWNGVPAILKGFFDRVLVPEFAYKYLNGLPIGLLKDKKAIVLTSTGGPKIYDFFLWGLNF